MLEEKVDIKQEFDNNIKALEENSRKKTQFLNTTLMVTGVCLFICVLCATILSYKNYVNAKNKSDNKVQVIELKNI